jgi:hypothetical protein
MYPHVVQFESRRIEFERELQSIWAGRQARGEREAVPGRPFQASAGVERVPERAGSKSPHRQTDRLSTSLKVEGEKQS